MGDGERPALELWVEEKVRARGCVCAGSVVQGRGGGGRGLWPSRGPRWRCVHAREGGEGGWGGGGEGTGEGGAPGERGGYSREQTEPPPLHDHSTPSFMQERFTSADKALTKSFKDAVSELGLCVCVVA